MEKTKYDVFISYSRKDTPIVDKICHALEEQNITYFVDRKGLAGGSEFPAELEEAIDNSSLVLYIASNNSYQSKFTTGEINYAFNEKEKGYVIPYIIDNSDLLSIRGMKIIFTNVNIRNIYEHPIETTLMQDLCERLDLQYKEPESIRIEKERKLAEEKAKQEEKLRKKILEEKKIQQEKLRKQQEEERIKREKELETLRKEQKRLMEDKRRREELQTLEEADYNRRLTIREIELKRLEEIKIKESIQEKAQIVSNIKTLKKEAILAIASFVNLLIVFFYGDLVLYWLYGNGNYTFWDCCQSPEEWDFTWANFINYHKFDFLSNPIKFNWRDCIISMSIVIPSILMLFSMMMGCMCIVGTKETPKDTETAIEAYAATFILAMLGVSVGLGYIYHSFFYGLCAWLLSIIVSILVAVLINRFINHHKNVLEDE